MKTWLESYQFSLLFSFTDWALRSGANAIEMDLQFDKRTGKPQNFYHGFPCDCSCLPPFLMKGNVCKFPQACSVRTPYAGLLRYVWKKNPHQLALIYLDSKNSKLTVHVQKIAGRNIVKAVEDHVLRLGYRGKVLIGAGSSNEYLKAVAGAARYVFQIVHKSIFNKFKKDLSFLYTVGPM